MQELEEIIEKLEKKIHELILDYTAKKSIRDKLEEEKASKIIQFEELNKEVELLEKVRILLQKTSEYAREQAKQQIEMLVTRCLQFIFGENIEFKIELSEVRGRPEAEFYVVSSYGDTSIITKPQDARGGGIVDVISLALRIAVIQCSNTYVNGPIILDEPAKHVSNEYISNVAQFLKQISKIFKRQIIMVTHNQFLSEIADLAYKVELKDGKSIVTLCNSNNMQ
ncbi:MAG: ATPase [Thermosediminibacteraceae bacterium]|nr:ATPase [Thermosediminibacteraceae bacterium]